ncbi:MAG: hypothetical protein ABSC91_10770 [Candidatus Bathyarchaeia archaeon]|jgi:hypothetical protein
MSTPIFESTSPLINDRFINPYIAGENLSPGSLVELTADWTVKKVRTQNSIKVVGITLTNAVAGRQVSVVGRGQCRVTIWGTTVVAGDQFGSGGGGDTAGTGSAGTAIQDNTTKNSSILGNIVQGAISGGTAVCNLW